MWTRSPSSIATAAILSFALVQNQDFANGLVVVTVVEGHIGSVRINGDLGNAKDRLESLAQRLKEEKAAQAGHAGARAQPDAHRARRDLHAQPGPAPARGRRH